MNLSWQRGALLPAKNKFDLLLALERGTERSRLWQSWWQVVIWVMPTIYFVFDIFALNCATCSSLISFLLQYNVVYSTTYVIEITALFICLLNLLVRFFEAVKYSYHLQTRRTPSKLTPQRVSSRGTIDQSGCSISSPTPSNHNFITQWLSALHFGKGVALCQKNLSSNHIRHNMTSPATSSPLNRSGSEFGDSALFMHSTSLVDHHSSYVERHSSHSVPLSAKVGSRASLRSRPISSIQTNNQLEEYLQKSPRNNELFKSFVAASSNSLSLTESERIISISGLASSTNNSYEVGTAMYDDEQGRVADDENSVVSLVTGSRIRVTDKRISLSPIPLNFIEVGNELTAEDGKGMASDGTDVARNADNDSITFRVNYNATKRSPKAGEALTPPLFRRSESNEESNRRHSESNERYSSPHSRSTNQLSNVPPLNSANQLSNVPSLNSANQFSNVPSLNSANQLSNVPPLNSASQLSNASSLNSTNQLSNVLPLNSANQLSNVLQLNGIKSNPSGKRIPITSSEILNQYRMGAEDFAIAERNLRSWICQTILRPLVEKIDEINAVFTKSHAHLHLKIGQSSVEALQAAASSKSDLLKSALPYIIPYLKIHERQSYLIKRCRELSADVCMKNYNWQGGGCEPVERKEEGEQGYSPAERAWGLHLPTDAQLIWSWFAVYMDARMGTNPLVNDIEMPFSSVFYLKKPSKPSQLQCMKKSFYIYQSSNHPPQFELVLDGGRGRFEVDRGSKNLWRTILLFIQHIRLFNEGQLGNIKIDENGINLACVLE